MSDNVEGKLIAEALNKADLLKDMSENLQEQINALSEAMEETVNALEEIRNVLTGHEIKIDMLNFNIRALGEK